MPTQFESLRVYLSGPMENQENCNDWRKNITAKLVKLGFNKDNIINPVDRRLAVEHRIDYFKKMKMWSHLEHVGDQVIKKDLRYVDVTDIVIVHFFEGVETAGTWDEIFTARNQRKPVFVIMPGGLTEKTSVWLLGRVGRHQIFSNMDEVMERLRAIRDDDIAPPRGWRNIHYETDGEVL
jgi:hypothetical protein